MSEIFTSEGQINIALKIVDAVVKEIPNGVKQRFRARIRELPSLISTLGLIPSIAFLYGMSKVGTECKDRIELFDRRIRGENVKLSSVVEKLSEEKAGYLLTLASILYYIKEVSKVLGINFESQSLEPRDILAKLLEHREVISIIEKFTIDFTLWLKKIAEGAIPE